MANKNAISEIGDGRLVKMEVDYSETVDKAIPEAENKAKQGKLNEAVDSLMALEKQARLAADMRSNSRLQVSIVKICFDAKNWDALNENIVALTKKRSLIKHAVTNMVQECCKFVDQTPNKEIQLKLIDTLRTVTAGKIYVEVERARLTYKLAQMREAEGNLDEACSIMLDLQLETYGSMERQEKVELLLEQMRLCLTKKDFVRSQIISRKISTKFFEDDKRDVQLLKLKYYQLMIQLDQNDGNYLATCRHYLAVYNTPMVKDDPIKMEEALKNVVIYVLLSPHSNEQSDLLYRVKADRNMERIPIYQEVMNMFTVQELVNWKQFCNQYQKVLQEGTKTSPPTGAFDLKTEAGKKRWEDLNTRVVEHNIRMIAKYYTRIRLSRMSELLDWPEKNTEDFLCQLVVDGIIPGTKIDRPAGIVNFQPKQSSVEALDDWSAKINSCMDSLNKVCHLIIKEEMVHKHLHGGTSGASTSAAAAN